VLREDALFELGLAWRPVRRCLLELGRRLMEAQAITRIEDVFWLVREELRSAAADLDAGRTPAPLRAKASERELAWRRRQGLNPPYILPLGSKPKFWWRYVFPVPELRAQEESGIVRGMGVSPGTVISVARVIRTQDEIDRLHHGEILVAHTTPPAWTPLLARAGGLVTDLGGPLTHGSIVAREYGIPAVMGTGSATRRIRDGERVTVDGTSGRVFIAGSAGKTDAVVEQVPANEG
jgi:pyruvate,water dikinase